MSLKHLKHQACPICGAAPTAWSVNWKHTNGQQSETLAFECHTVLRWSPNFSRQEVSTRCPNDPVRVGRITMSQDGLSRLLAVVEQVEKEAWPTEDDGTVWAERVREGLRMLRDIYPWQDQSELEAYSYKGHE